MIFTYSLDYASQYNKSFELCGYNQQVHIGFFSYLDLMFLMLFLSCNHDKKIYKVVVRFLPLFTLTAHGLLVILKFKVIWEKVEMRSKTLMTRTDQNGMTDCSANQAECSKTLGVWKQNKWSIGEVNLLSLMMPYHMREWWEGMEELQGSNGHIE